MADTCAKKVVIALGPWGASAGFAGESAPNVVIPNEAQNAGIDDINKVLENIFSDLKVKSEDCKVLVGMSVLTPNDVKCQIAELLFKQFHCQSAFIAIGDVLTLYANGLENGINVDVVEKAKPCTPLLEGFAVREAVTTADTEANIGQAIYNSVQKVKEIRGSEKVAYVISSIILSGGEKIPDKSLCARVKKELEEKLPKGSVFRVAITGSEHSTFIGGSILASLDDFQGKWVTKAEYDQSGFEVVAKKCA